jgi:hypothetical protein
MQELPRDHPRWGWEFDWLGIDRYGHVAVFSNAGCGPLPEPVNEHLADVDAALARADELPVIGSAASDKNPEGGDCSFWYSYSAKGFYAYDWRRNWDGPYRRLSSPTVPISIDRLPDQLQAIARLAVFPVNFADEPEITIECVLSGYGIIGRPGRCGTREAS